MPEKPSNQSEEPSYKEQRIRAITRIYYSKPEVQQALLAFAQSREVVPRYFEAFGKRPDILQYPSDIQSAVQKGATSFHASEELWRDPLQISTDSSLHNLQDLRIGWDLLIDIDSPYLDYSKIAAQLVCITLEKNGITNYGMKFSGSKGFHIIVPNSAFPLELEGHKIKDLFPDLARAITEFILHSIRESYNAQIIRSGLNFEAIQRRTNLSKEDLVELKCPQCNNPAQKEQLTFYVCDTCRSELQRKGSFPKKEIVCTNTRCPGMFHMKKTEEHYTCKACNLSSKDWGTTVNKLVSERNLPESANFEEHLSGEKLGSLDLVLVSPRHLFRMPYSLHEKTGLASIVLTKEQLPNFSPKLADPLHVVIKEFYPSAPVGEASRLIQAALAWKRLKAKNEPIKKIEYSKEFTETELKNVPEELYPESIKKLLEGLTDGRKRGLFVLITFLRCIGKNPDEITKAVMAWNEKNDPPLKEGYVKTQLEWHFKQTRKILPPNYENASFYKDLGLISDTPPAKNPLVEVSRALKKSLR
jgi:hypothetical protein